MPSALTSVGRNGSLYHLEPPPKPKILGLRDCKLDLQKSSFIVRDIVLRAEWQELKWERSLALRTILEDAPLEDSMSFTALYQKSVAYLNKTSGKQRKADKAPFAPTLLHMEVIDEAIQKAEEDRNLLLFWKRIIPNFIVHKVSIPEKLLEPGIQDVPSIENFLLKNYDKLKQIYYLDLSNLGLTLVPKALRKFMNLRYLDLSGNYLSSIESFFGDMWEDLFHLNLSGNHLTHLPQQFGFAWKNLKHLSLSGNRITHLPARFGDNWEDLECLFIQDNNIFYLPDHFLNLCENLRIVCLSRNRLKNLPKGMGSEWGRLQILLIQSNYLQKLDPSFGKNWDWWPKLKDTALKGNLELCKASESDLTGS
jgi:Leucine-rich repeat (LRR) protein